ncbi:hypothetical protein [Mesoterricola silvestris]|uniref:Uncharacterized protein n=1 Tax=Mesoterricola silvestris TaxID=2927979 RepID=A0AA48K8T9_9BACT|nr:hypothetical protein [Mesoterricola silvestris]BDU71632.1 hypothetical protein METEAL_08060 [Mesoterricola silvestris]
MHLTSITHRKELFELATRWFADCPLRGDGRFLTQVTTYENLISAPVVRDLLTGIKQAVHPGPVTLTRLRSKDELRDAIVASCRNPGPREQELFSLYRNHPEDFFPGTPSDVMLGLREDGTILGMARIKRLRRIAEKCSRRVADRLAGAINERARLLAQQRAETYGIPLKELLSSKQEMAQDYDQAERIVSRTFRDGVLVFKPEDLRIDDGIGLKFVGTPEEMDSMEEAIRRHPSVLGVVKEEHRGRYNDINLLVDLKVPEPGVLVDLARDWDWARHAGKGLTPQELAEGFPGFVEGGQRSFRAEVILTTASDLVESEFGSCIHEARILEQRAGVTYSGRIASNASFLIEYMLMLALSPTLEVGELPVKMWGRYLPDVYSLAVWRLFGITLGRDQIDHLVPWGVVDAGLAFEHGL